MPLTQEDKHWWWMSRDWPRFSKNGDPYQVKRAYARAVGLLPYGTYVMQYEELRIETQELLEKLESNLNDTELEDLIEYAERLVATGKMCGAGMLRTGIYRAANDLIPYARSMLKLKQLSKGGEDETNGQHAD